MIGKIYYFLLKGNYQASFAYFLLGAKLNANSWSGPMPSKGLIYSREKFASNCKFTCN